MTRTEAERRVSTVLTRRFMSPAELAAATGLPEAEALQAARELAKRGHAETHATRRLMGLYFRQGWRPNAANEQARRLNQELGAETMTYAEARKAERSANQKAEAAWADLQLCEREGTPELIAEAREAHCQAEAEYRATTIRLLEKDREARSIAEASIPA